MSVGGKRPLTLAQLLARPLKPSARELFPLLRARLLDSRPMTRQRVTYTGRTRTVEKYGAPTFRNVIENGKHV